MFSYVCQSGPSTETMNLSNLGARAAVGEPHVLECAGELAARPDRRARARDPVTTARIQQQIDGEAPSQDSVAFLAECRHELGARRAPLIALG